jgi:hypothetical protein
MPCNFRVGPLVALAAAGFFLTRGVPAAAFEPSSVAVLYFYDGERNYTDQPFDYYQKRYGDACTGQLADALKQRGFKVVPIGRPEDEEPAGATAKLRGLTPVLVSVTIRPWAPIGSIRNASHFAKFLFSPPYREYQSREGAGERVESVAYVRAALIASAKQPVIRPSDLKGRPIRSPNDFAGESGNEVANLPMADLFPFDLDDPLKTKPNPKVKPLSDSVYFVTSHTLLDSADDQLRALNYVALTTSNVISAELSFGGIDQHPAADLSAAFRTLLDDVALQCSQANYNEELSELSRLRQSGRNLIPVDLDAFQQQAREDVRKEIDDAREENARCTIRCPSVRDESLAWLQYQMELFDQIQALK